MHNAILERFFTFFWIKKVRNKDMHNVQLTVTPGRISPHTEAKKREGIVKSQKRKKASQWLAFLLLNI